MDDVYEIKNLLKIIELANNEYHYSELNDQFNQLSELYNKKEITYEKFLEEYELIKMVMKLIDT